jgi:hypothetical protein
MHDRSFFLADVLAIIYFIYHTDKWYYPVALFICSFNDYIKYLFGSQMMDERLAR